VRDIGSSQKAVRERHRFFPEGCAGECDTCVLTLIGNRGHCLHCRQYPQLPLREPQIALDAGGCSAELSDGLTAGSHDEIARNR
jgi:hypothetical protein